MSTRRIHHVQTTHKDRWVADPEEGMIKRREQIMKPSSTERIVHAGQTYEIRNGTFEVPEDVAAHLLRMPGWHEGDSPFSEEEDTAKPKVRRTA